MTIPETSLRQLAYVIGLERRVKELEEIVANAASARYGSRPVTKQDRALAIKRELLRTTSPITFTPGMRRTLQERKKK